MKILEFLSRTPARDFKKDLTALRTEVHSAIVRQRFEMQGYMDALTGEESSSLYGANNYKDYAKTVQAVNSKYENSAVWGNGLTANIIDFRAAVTVSSGPQYRPAKRSAIPTKDEDGKGMGSRKDGEPGKAPSIEESADAEMEFVRAFYEANDLNHEGPQELGREGEIEGRVAVVLDWDDDRKQTIFRHLPWIDYRYVEVRNPKNPKRIDEIKWDANEAAGIAAGSASGDLLVCRRFAGRPRAKHPTTRVMRCLTQIEYVDQAFRDWREIDRLYGSPIPDFEFKTKDEAEAFQKDFRFNWKIKRAMIHNGTFLYKGPDMAGVDSIEREIKRQACFISGTTGYPLQFLLPDMLSNRSTSENIMESALVHTASERAIWTGFYEELVSKAMKLYSLKTSKKKLDPSKIAISISLMTTEQWNRLVTFWLPAWRDELVTREAALSNIPDFNVREELDRVEGADRDRVAQIGEELDRTAGAGAEGEAAPADGEKVADASLNGAQISSMVEVLSSASDGTIPTEAVLPILQAAFPNTDPALILKMAASVVTFAKEKAKETEKNKAALPDVMKANIGKTPPNPFQKKKIPGQGEEEGNDLE
jgi:hypothetical protein